MSSYKQLVPINTPLFHSFSSLLSILSKATIFVIFRLTDYKDLDLSSSYYKFSLDYKKNFFQGMLNLLQKVIEKDPRYWILQDEKIFMSVL